MSEEIHTFNDIFWYKKTVVEYNSTNRDVLSSGGKWNYTLAFDFFFDCTLVLVVTVIPHCVHCMYWWQNSLLKYIGYCAFPKCAYQDCIFVTDPPCDLTPLPVAAAISKMRRSGHTDILTHCCYGRPLTLQLS